MHYVHLVMKAVWQVDLDRTARRGKHNVPRLRISLPNIMAAHNVSIWLITDIYPSHMDPGQLLTCEMLLFDFFLYIVIIFILHCAFWFTYIFWLLFSHCKYFSPSIWFVFSLSFYVCLWTNVWVYTDLNILFPISWKVLCHISCILKIPKFSTAFYITFTFIFSTFDFCEWYTVKIESECFFPIWIVNCPKKHLVNIQFLFSNL